MLYSLEETKMHEVAVVQVFGNGAEWSASGLVRAEGTNYFEPGIFIQRCLVMLILLDELRRRLSLSPSDAVARFRDEATLRVGDAEVKLLYQRADNIVRHISESDFELMVAHCRTADEAKKWRTL